MARNETMMRTFKVLHLLETTRAGRTLEEIRNRLKEDGIECSVKTLRRDIELIEGAKIDLEKIKTADAVRYKLNSIAEISPNVRFYYHDVMAYFIARKFLEHLKGSPLYAELDKFFTKLEKLFGSDCEYIEQFVDILEFSPKMTWHNSVPAPVLDTVYEALERGSTLKFEYKAEAGEQAGEFAIRMVGPECLYFADAGVYLIAKDLNKNEPRTYSLARMRNVEDLPDNPYKKEGIEPKELFKDSFGLLNTGKVEEVEILLEGPTAKYISERKWHHSQKNVNRSDGLHLFMKVKINKEFARWVLGLGDGATVLKPDNLKSLVAELVEKIRQKYTKDKAA